MDISRKLMQQKMRRHSNARHVSREPRVWTVEAGCVELDDGSKFELVEKFCYLGDMLCAGGGAEEAMLVTRVRSAWGKFNLELAPVLTKRGVLFEHMKGKIYACLCTETCLVYGSETWAMKSGGLVARLRRAERMMVRRMCGVSLANDIESAAIF